MMLKKLAMLFAGGEAPALLTRAPPHARDAHVRVAVARDHVLLDGEKVMCALLPICSCKNDSLMVSITSRMYSRPRKISAGTTITSVCGTSRSEKNSSRASEQRLAPRCAADSP